jgi:predicted peptidase
LIAIASILASVAFLGIATGDDLKVPPEFAGLFEAHEFRYTGGKYKDELFRYRLFVPRNQSPGVHYPLLLWLHGHNESGSDNRFSLRHLNLVLNDVAHAEKYRYFVLVLQCPEDDPSWFRIEGVEDPSDMLSITSEILQKTMQDYPVDRDRICVSGACSGGSGCWELAGRHPEWFAAVSPLTAGGGNVMLATRLVNIPIWAFHNQGEHPEGDVKMVSAIQEAGGNACLTIPAGGEHDCWTTAFRRYEIVPWMLAQRRGAWICWTPPGCRIWRWWHILPVPMVIITTVIWSWRVERKRRQRKQRDTTANTKTQGTSAEA